MELKLVLESILFSSQKPLSIVELRACIKEAPGYAEEPIPTELQQVKAAVLEQTLEDLSRDINVMGRSFRLTCVAGSWQFVNAPEYVAWIKALVGHRPRAPRLTQAALETLAIIAYRQPLTRAEAEQIRGVSVDGVLKMLIDRGLVEQAGRAEVLGRPMTFKTTELFLEYFGLKNLEDLPAADDLRRVPVDKPPGLNTSDPELDTAETSDSEADTVEESSDNDPEAENDASDPNDVDKAFDADDAKDSGEDEEDEDWESDDLKEDDESSAGDGFDDDAELENDPSRN
ncbi:MAG: SMC-Scp complex subunit ScpB [Verrucomicrobiae bacterium]|nr:SMC-Scp complex subunit ScpB [Verrucomicrobiae bacterium]